MATAVAPHVPVTPLGQKVEVIGWRCDLCRHIQPLTLGSYVVHVEEAGPLRNGQGGIRSRARYIARYVVCMACRRSITDFEP